jgi:Uma2 family endonuclease
MTTARTGTMTADEFWEWCNRPENLGKRAELVRGEIVEMSSPGERHGLLCAWIAFLLLTYVRSRRKGAVAANDTGLIVEEGPDTVRGPDVILFPESIPVGQASPRHPRRIPELVVEVLSPNDSWTALLRRVKQYHQRGIALVWIVDPDPRTLTVCRPNEVQQLLEETEEVTGNGVLPDFRLPVAELFNLPE